MALRRWLALALVFGLSALPGVAAQAQEGVKLHALTLGDAPKYGPDFKRLDYVNPDALKGGTINTGATGTFDSFNPFIVKGTPAGTGGLYDTLTPRPRTTTLPNTACSRRAWRCQRTSPGSSSICGRRRAGTMASR